MKGWRAPDAGQLDRLAVLEANEPVLDAFGGRRDHWVERARVSVRLEPLGQTADPGFDQKVAATAHRVTMRFHDGVVRGMAFRLGDRRLLARTVDDPDERRRFLVCGCEETS